MALTELRTAATFEIGDPKVIVAGDWHADRHWLARAIPAAASTGASTILHLGDFGFLPRETADWLGRLDYWAATSHEHRLLPGIERVLITPGSQDDWDGLANLFATAPGHAIQVSETVWVLPRGFRFSIGGRTLVSFGGGASADWAERDRGRDWWPAELPTVDEVWLAARDGHVDILLTHDGGVVRPRAVDQVVNDPMAWLTSLDHGYTSYSRFLVGEVVEAVTPTLHLHAHYGVRDSTARDLEGLRPLRVEALSGEGRPGNMILLHLGDLSITEIDVP